MQISNAICAYNQQSQTPLVVLLHGWGADERDLPGLLDMIAPNTQYVSLQAPFSYSFGFTWFDQWDHEGVPTGASLQVQAAGACEAIYTWLDEHIDSNRPLIPFGFSQGGLLATHLLRIRPERCMAAVSCSGWIVDAALPYDAQLAALHLPVFYGHGADDTIFPQDMVDYTSAFWQAHADLEEHVYAGMAHSINMKETRDIAAFLERVGAIRPRFF